MWPQAPGHHQGRRGANPPAQLSGPDWPARDPESLRVTEGRISPTHTGPVVTAIQTIAGSLAPLGATSARHRERTYSVFQALAPRGVGVREGSLWTPPHPTPVPRTHPEPGSQEAPAL